MKKVLALLLALALTLGAAAAVAEGAASELALITDKGTIDDKSFNQGAWEGLVQYAEEFGIAHTYYKPAEATDEDYLNAIDLAVTGGAKFIVTPGFLFEPAVYMAQDLYPDVTFLLIDGQPHTADYSEYRTEANVLCVLYKEEQSGFLAGYAAVMDGYRKLGFMGGQAVPAVIRFGYGFVQGASYAAKELGLEAGAVSVRYNYTGSFVATPEIQTQASAWYNDGVECIFACGGGIYSSIQAAAEATEDKVLIGVDSDQGVYSERIITSAMKTLQSTVYMALEDYYAGEYEGGTTWNLGADTDSVGLPMESSRFNAFTQEQYDAIYAKLAGNVDGLTDGLLTDATAASATEVAEKTGGLVTVEVVE